ncbi:MAG: helix-turn-helix domain-containing protein [Oscillospiraceae bacterium]|nr:helix-turn-helix domain-containing protein [Oscillospiraceae bacterium]
MAGKWSAEETALLKELLTAHTVREARQKLGRSEYAVRKQMRKLKDSKDPVKYEDMNREDGENIRRMYKRAENKVERLKILKELYPSYTKETILAAALHNPFLESDKFYEQITKEQNEVKKVIKGFDEETKAAAVRAVMLDGEKVTTVAERYGISDQTVYNWVKRAKKTQQQFIDYAEKTEKELAEEKDAEPEDKKIDWQRLEKASAERNKKVVDNLGLGQKRDVEDAIPYAKDETDTVYEYVDEGSKTAIDEKAIKAAAFDVITNQMNDYPSSNTDTMMRFIQGVQALAGQLCEAQGKC